MTQSIKNTLRYICEMKKKSFVVCFVLVVIEINKRQNIIFFREQVSDCHKVYTCTKYVTFYLEFLTSAPHLFYIY